MRQSGVEHEPVGERFAAPRLLQTISRSHGRLAGQGIRFVLAGTAVVAVYVSITTLLHGVLALPFQLALIIGFTTSVALHFTLQRQFVWRGNETFALGIHHQAFRYLLICALQYGVTAFTTSQLPGPLGLPVEVVYVLTVMCVPVVNFVVFRGRVFHVLPAPDTERLACVLEAHPAGERRADVNP
jgi:putative flippase GtrA